MNKFTVKPTACAFGMESEFLKKILLIEKKPTLNNSQPSSPTKIVGTTYLYKNLYQRSAAGNCYF